MAAANCRMNMGRRPDNLIFLLLFSHVSPPRLSLINGHPVSVSIRDTSIIPANNIGIAEMFRYSNHTDIQFETDREDFTWKTVATANRRNRPIGP
jgi:hypothetical protein